MKADELLEQLDSPGAYQRRLLISVYIISMINAWGPLTVIFTHYEPKYICLWSEELNKSAVKNDVWNTTCVTAHGQPDQNPCEATLLAKSANSTEVLVPVPCTHWIFHTEDDGGDTVVSEMELVCDEDWILPFAISLTMVGRTIGSTTCGAIADRFGRRPVYLGSSVLLTLGTLGIGLSRNVYAYASSLALMATFSGVQFFVVFVIGTEMVLPKYRNGVGLVLSAGYVSGYALLPLLAYLSADWHVLLYVITAASSLYSIGYWTFPETLHWLMSKGYCARANALLAEIASYNKTDFKADNAVQESLAEDTTEVKESGTGTALDMLKHPVMRIRLLAIVVSWFVSSFVYYAITLNSSYLPGDRYINCLASALLELPSIALSFVLVGKIGRVKTSAIFFSLCGVSCIMAPLFKRLSSIALSVVAIAGKTAVSGSMYVIMVHTVELTPTFTRNFFMGICNSFAHAGSFVSPFVMYLGRILDMEILPYTVMGCAAVVAAVLTIFLLPETVGTHLPRSIEEASQQKTLCNNCFTKLPKEEISLTSQVEEEEAEHLQDTV